MTHKGQFCLKKTSYNYLEKLKQKMDILNRDEQTNYYY